MGEERRRKRSRATEQTARGESEEATHRKLERDASKEAVEEEEKTGGALPRTRSGEDQASDEADEE